MRALMRSRAFFFVIAWQILNATFQNLVSTGWPFTRRYWIGVQVLTEQITKLMSYALFSLTVYVVRERFLHTNWRMMLLCSVVVIPIVDIPLGYANVYDIGWGRSQYFSWRFPSARRLPCSSPITLDLILAHPHSRELCLPCVSLTPMPRMLFMCYAGSTDCSHVCCELPNRCRAHE